MVIKILQSFEREVANQRVNVTSIAWERFEGMTDSILLREREEESKLA